MSLIVDIHRQYLSDPVRLAAFRAAIQEAVAPGAVVLDLGSGTGVLGLFACEAGAARVYCVDDGGILEVARAIAAANGLTGRMRFVNAHSSDAVLPERVDVIVADLIGRFAIDGSLVEDLADARHRLLKPGGALVPSAVDLEIAPVEYPAGTADIDFWRSRPAGFDMSPARRWAINTGYPTTFAREALLGAPECLTRLDLSSATAAPLTMDALLTVDRGGTLHGLGGWFRAQLSPGVVLSNSPLATERLNRRGVFFPIDRPTPVAPGDVVRVSMRVIPAETMIGWTVDVGGRARFAHSTFAGMLVSREDLRRMDPRFVPTLTRRGAARLSVLSLCDGSRPLADVERELFRRHPDLFPSAVDAGAFVAEVVSRYAL